MATSVEATSSSWERPRPAGVRDACNLHHQLKVGCVRSGLIPGSSPRGVEAREWMTER